jgi:hypothetical protein
VPHLRERGPWPLTLHLHPPKQETLGGPRAPGNSSLLHGKAKQTHATEERSRGETHRWKLGVRPAGPRSMAGRGLWVRLPYWVTFS